MRAVETTMACKQMKKESKTVMAGLLVDFGLKMHLCDEETLNKRIVNLNNVCFKRV